MKGDFSTLRHDPQDNDQAVLYQQGRVTLDADLTASELIDLSWRAQAGRDVIGAGVAAVPAADSDGFKVMSAEMSGAEVRLGLHPGRVWADGILAHLTADPQEPAAAVERVATYLDEPLNPAGTDTGSIAAGVRDAVILELALEELNGFQDPWRLIEPALGGPDTSERVTTRLGLRLLRLGQGEDCTTIAGKLRDGPAGKGRLTVSLEPATTIAGDCPVVAGGGYSGMEHNLYRVEIAALNGGQPQFKWSRFNGGLVGRGTFTAAAPQHCAITANRTAIVSSQLTDFYLEALELEEQLGHWRVVYGAMATLNGDHELELAAAPLLGTFPSTAGSVFFRLWDGIATVASFAGAPKELIDAINLNFQPASATATYRPGDHWTFPVRAGEVFDDETLVDDEPPQGIVLRRVPLAEITWSAPDDAESDGVIEDCRRRFPPLTNLKTCCTVRVGDGVQTFGDFNSLEEAAAHLPAKGGELCLLGGLHYANLELAGAKNIAIHGCPRQTMVLPRKGKADQPIIRMTGCAGITISDLDLVSFFGPLIVGDGKEAGDLSELVVADCRMTARTFAVQLDHAADIAITGNRIRLLDTTKGRCAIQLRGTGALVERNDIVVWPFHLWFPGTPGAGDTPTPIDPCAEPEELYGVHLPAIVILIASSWTLGVAAPPKQPYRALGGIHLLGGCDQVRILENHVDGGAGHGIALGGLLPGDVKGPGPAQEGQPTAFDVKVRDDEPGLDAFVWDESGKAVPDVDLYLVDPESNIVAGHEPTDSDGYAMIEAKPGSYLLKTGPGHVILSVEDVPPKEIPEFRYHIVVKAVDVPVGEEQGFLYEIAIERNDIERMALSGVGFLPFADIGEAAPVAGAGDLGPFGAVVALLAPRELMSSCNVVQDLVIRDNRIHDNLKAVFDQALRKASRTVGQGGISLALVETALIAANHIYDNGVSAADGVCGIFIGHGEDVEIDSNHVSGNGAVLERYEEEKTEAIRGGIVVRLASSFLVGEATGGRQKPALRISGNRIDQPAGRAITAFVFGPASCVSNYLNSERTGRLGLLDAVVGGVLIADLGGFQLTGRPSTQLAFKLQKAPGAVLPGGELLFDDNQVRLGRDHRSAIGVALVTADDLGCSANQCTVMRGGRLFSGGVCIAPSVRATGNRFREHADQCWFSLLSAGVAFGGGRPPAMNTTALNQGDHCIVATSFGSGPAEIIDELNLEAGSSAEPDLPCAVLRRKGEGAGAGAGPLKAYIGRGIAATFDSGEVTSAEFVLAISVAQAVQSVAKALSDVAGGYGYITQVESARVQSSYGADSPRATRARTNVARSSGALGLLKAESQLLTIRAVAPQQGAAVVDGRVSDGRRGLPGYEIELLRRGGTPVASATSEGSGYFAVELDAEQTSTLEGQPLDVRAKDPAGRVVFKAEKPVRVAAGETVRVPITIAAVRTAPPAKAGVSGLTAVSSTPLETIRGIGPRTAERLRAAGIADVEALLRTPTDRLVELAGKDAAVLAKHIEQATGGTAIDIDTSKG